ncbi:MAG: prolyl oligopeptidase family serine peptidase [Candidatus Sericytochromatia bacterium]
MKQIKEKFEYPISKKEEVYDNYHGTIVHDPYRWLEDPKAEDTKKWVTEQNKLTQSYIAEIPVRKEIKDRLLELWDYPKYSIPHKHGKNYFVYKNSGLQNQSVLYKEAKLDDHFIEVLDPNKLSDEGVAALTTAEFNKEGTLLAYGISKNGSDKQEIKIRNIETGKDFDETLKWCRFSGIAWKKESDGFFYNRFPETGSVLPEDEGNFSKIYYHKIGTPQTEDILIHEDKENKEAGFYPYISENKDYLIIHEYYGTATQNNLYVKKVDTEEKLHKLFEKADYSYEYVYNEGEYFFIKTDHSSPNYKLIAFNINDEKKEWKTIIPEHEKDVLSSIHVINHRFVVVYMHHAHHLLKIYDFEGNFINEVKLPTIGSIEDISGSKDDDEMFIRFTSFTYPATAFTYDFNTNELKEYRKSEIKFNPADFETKQVFYPSKDGTKVSMFLAYKKGLELNGNNPVLLYGYGGFNVSLNPNFSIQRIALLELGFVFAMPNLRGGGEYGELWHEAGMLDKKQNVFDDFISAGEWLIENKYTNNSKLAINGGSNGGLLVSATMVQRPDLFGAVICAVPVIDMLRYHKFTIGRYWIPEYGNAEANKTDFDFMYKYSPLHNVKEVEYPSLLIVTADTDDRVVPAHAMKFASTIQEKNTSNKPMLIRIETHAGHGLGKPTSKLIEEQSDIYAFLFRELKLEN